MDTKEAFADSALACARSRGERLIGCIIPAYNEAENLKILVPLLCDQMKALSVNVEITIVDDGSKDATAEVAIALASQYPVRLIQLSRNFGKENALTAGIDHARGDAVLLIDADMEHPLGLLPKFLELWSEGYDMIYGVQEDRENESYWKRKLTGWFYRILNRLSEVPIEPNAGDFRLLDRKVVDAIRTLRERCRFMKGLYGWLGFKSIGVPFAVKRRRAGKSRFSFWRLVELAVTGFTSFTSIPLRIWGGIGAIISLVSIVYGLYIAVRTTIFGVDVQGWATLTVGIMFLGGVQLLSIGVLGEYIARIFTEVKLRPPYVVSRRYDYAGVSEVNQSGQGCA